MDTITSNKMHINVTSVSNTATIHLSGHFSFDVHREFKAAYKNQISNPKIDNIVVNLQEVMYLNSSALGMLLVLRDHAQAGNKSLTLSRPRPIVVHIFDVAKFDKKFTIN